jgi:phosphoribosylaminoimidazole-succinocarboxamide synthase
MKKIYEGKAKIVFEGETDDTVVMQFKNSLTAFDGMKKAELKGKGELNWKISALLMSYIQNKGIPTHFIKNLDQLSSLCQKVNILPIEVVCRNKAAGSFCKRYGIEEGFAFSNPLVEFFYKKDELHDPLLSEDVILTMKLASVKEISLLKYYCLLINHFLKELFLLGNIELIDFKLEFGINKDGKLLLADEITPDTMRLWKKNEKSLAEKILDKDRFRRDLGPVDYGYSQILSFLLSHKLDEIVISNPEAKIIVHVNLKSAVSDAAGETTLLALKRSGFNFSSLRIGKLIVLEDKKYISPDKFEKICQNFLINPLIEDYSVFYNLKL